MRFFRFAEILRYGCLAILGLAVAFAVVVVLSSPTAADSHTRGDGDSDSDRTWDTDNLVFSGFTARSFAIPHYSQNNTDPVRTGTRTVAGYLGIPYTFSENQSLCQPYVIDGCFQNLASQPRNDLPVLEKPVGGSWAETAGNICDDFSQHRMLP